MGNIITNLWRRVRPEKWGGSWFYSIGTGGSNAFQDVENLKSFLEVPELNAVINWKASAFRNARINKVNENGDVIEENVPLFESPNPLQAKGEFLRQTKLFHEIFGNEYLYFLSGTRPNGNNIQGMYTLPPQYMCVKSSDNKFWLMRDLPEIKYQLEWANQKFTLDQSRIIHYTDNKVDVNYDNFLIGESKIQAVRAPVNNIRAAYDSRHTNLTEGGPRGILSNNGTDAVGTVPLDAKEKQQLHDDYATHGSLRGQKRLIITNLALQWQQMGFSTTHQRSFEEVTQDHHKLCDEFGLSADIFSREKGSTFENKKVAEKSAYQNTIIPEFNEWMNGINAFFGMERERYVGDFSHLPVFAEDMQAKASTLNTAVDALNKLLAAGVITEEEYREQIDYFMM